MVRTGLEFAPGTTEDCKRLVVGLFKPADILDTYRKARSKLKTGDLVLVTAQHDPSGFKVKRRAEYVAEIRLGMGEKAETMLRVLAMAHKSAHQVASLPAESDAMWLVIARPQAIPIMVVLFSMPYAVEGAEGGTVELN